MASDLGRPPGSTGQGSWGAQCSRLCAGGRSSWEAVPVASGLGDSWLQGPAGRAPWAGSRKTSSRHLGVAVWPGQHPPLSSRTAAPRPPGCGGDRPCSPRPRPAQQPGPTDCSSSSASSSRPRRHLPRLPADPAVGCWKREEVVVSACLSPGSGCHWVRWQHSDMGGAAEPRGALPGGRPQGARTGAPWGLPADGSSHSWRPVWPCRRRAGRVVLAGWQQGMDSSSSRSNASSHGVATAHALSQALALFLGLRGPWRRAASPPRGQRQRVARTQRWTGACCT